MKDSPSAPKDEQSTEQTVPATESTQGEIRPSELPPGPLGDGAELEPQAEMDLWVGRTRWQHFAGRILLWIIGIVAAAVLTFWLTSRIEEFNTSTAIWIVLGLTIASAAVILGPIFVRIISQRYRLTTQRLFVERGIISQTIDQTELIRVDDVRVKKTLADRIFGLGSVLILSTDLSDSEVVVTGILAPEKVAEHIRGRMRAMRSKSLFVENL